MARYNVTRVKSKIVISTEETFWKILHITASDMFISASHHIVLALIPRLFNFSVL